MEHLQQPLSAPDVVGAAAPGEARSGPPPPSEDQPYFNESLHAGLRGLGKLVRARRKPPR